MIAGIRKWLRGLVSPKVETKPSPQVSFFGWMSIKETNVIPINWSGSIEDQWSMEVGSSSFTDWECGYPREKEIRA